MSVVGKIGQLFFDKEKTQPAFPVTKTKAVTNEKGENIDAILNKYKGSTEGVVKKAEVSDSSLNSLKLNGKTSDSFAKSEDAFGTYEAVLSGNTITLQSLSFSKNIKFIAPVTFSAKYTFTVNGEQVTAKTMSGESLQDGFFASGSVVTCYLNGNTLNFNGGGGLTAADKQTVRNNMLIGKSILGGSVSGTFENELTFIIFRGHRFGAKIFTNQPKDWNGAIASGKYRANYTSKVLQSGTSTWITIDGATAVNDKVYDFSSGNVSIGLHQSDSSVSPGDIEGAMAISVLRLVREG